MEGGREGNHAYSDRALHICVGKEMRMRPTQVVHVCAWIPSESMIKLVCMYVCAST